VSSTIQNAKNTPLNVQTGTIPNVYGALLNWFQPMVFKLVTKSVKGFREVETKQAIEFEGVIQPFKARDLILKPEGQRAWTWLWLHASPSLALSVDDIVDYDGVPTRVMSKTDYSIYGYITYQLVQDWT
jgi:hypothetical protein